MPAVLPAAAPVPETGRFRNELKNIEGVKASELIPEPKNPRVHGHEQREAMVAVLTQFGKCSSLQAIETPDGLMLLDGHLRQDLDAAEEWDVEILDLRPEEADLLLRRRSGDR